MGEPRDPEAETESAASDGALAPVQKRVGLGCFVTWLLGALLWTENPEPRLCRLASGTFAGAWVSAALASSTRWRQAETPTPGPIVGELEGCICSAPVLGPKAEFWAVRWRGLPKVEQDRDSPQHRDLPGLETSLCSPTTVVEKRLVP